MDQFAANAFSEGTPNGYSARDGGTGALLALSSLQLRARFFVLSIATREGARGLPLKKERAPLRVRGGPDLDGIVFSNRADQNLVHLGPFGVRPFGTREEIIDVEVTLGGFPFVLLLARPSKVRVDRIVGTSTFRPQSLVFHGHSTDSALLLSWPGQQTGAPVRMTWTSAAPEQIEG